MKNSQQCDPFGLAFSDHLNGETGNHFSVYNNKGEDESWPVSYFFRTYEEMPELEKTALATCSGKVLDIGAGAGCHSLVLQERGFDVTALDNKPDIIDVLQRRGIAKTIEADIMHFRENTYDTLLLLMNGSGIFGTLENLAAFLPGAKQLLNPGGQILIDSSDLMYLYEEDDGSVRINLNDSYYGEVIYRVEYKDCKSEPFPWLFVDFSTLGQIAADAGLRSELLFEGEHFDYLARIY